MGYSIHKSQSLYTEANHYIPGGVNSPVRAFKSVGGNPVFMQSAKGAYLYDADGNAYVDLINSWGPMILGHALPEVEEAVMNALKKGFSFGTPTEIEVEMAKLVTSAVPSVGKVRMVNSGTEATMSAIRLARGYTGRDKIIKFAGCYHGHGDSFLISAGSGALTFGTPNSPGVTKGTANDTLIAQFNDLAEVQTLAAANKGEIAAIILEPVTGNMGVIRPDEGFMEGLRELCDAEGILLIFDEVMTCFRLSWEGAQGVLGVEPDLTCFGKIIGGGMPVGAYGGRTEIMNYVSPQGPVYQAGTLSGNPIAMHSGYATLNYLKSHPEIYDRIDQNTERMADGINEILIEAGILHKIGRVGSMFTVFFTDQAVRDYAGAKACDTELFGQFFKEMLKRGIYLPPSQFEALFVSAAIGDSEIDKVLSATRESVGYL